MDAPTFWETLSLSAGRLRSFKPAATRHHFITGAQKNTVFGPIQNALRHASLRKNVKNDAPAGWFMKAWNFDAPADAAAPDMAQECVETEWGDLKKERDTKSNDRPTAVLQLTKL